jgi:hypothetical protein
MRALPAVLVLLSLAGCAEPMRRALPAPFSLTGGAVPVPAHGIALAAEQVHGLRGQELDRTQVIAAGLVAGVQDAFSLGLYTYRDMRQGGVAGDAVEAKGPVVRVGSRGLVALRGAVSYSSRRDSTAQNEALTTWDLAVPFSLRVDSGRGDPEFVALYAGPRLVYEHYVDRLLPGQSMDAAMPGVLLGVHLALNGLPLFRDAEGLTGLHVFAEATLTRVPRNVYQGASYGGQMAVMPAVGWAFQFGRPFRWRR